MSAVLPSDSDQPLILIIDDAIDILEIWQLLLESSGFRVIIAANGMSGLEKAKRLRPDLIISDYMMPGMDGLTLCRNIKIDPTLTGVPVVLWSAAGVNLNEPIIDRYLRKPVFLEELVDEIRALLPESA